MNQLKLQCILQSAIEAGSSHVNNTGSIKDIAYQTVTKWNLDNDTLKIRY